MKKFIPAILAFALLLVTLFTFAPVANAAVLRSHSSATCSVDLPGTWGLTVTFPNGLVEQTHMQFTATDSGTGYLVEHNNVSPGNHYGIWYCKSPSDFELTFIEPNVDTNGTKIGWIVINHPNDTLTDSTHWSGNAQATIYDLHGKQVGTGTSSVVAVKS